MGKGGGNEGATSKGEEGELNMWTGCAVPSPWPPHPAWRTPGKRLDTSCYGTARTPWLRGDVTWAEEETE